MVQVRLLTSLVTPTESLGDGDVFSCDEGTAQRLIASGQAVPFVVGGVELAVGVGVETAMKPKARGRARV